MHIDQSKFKVGAVVMQPSSLPYVIWRSREGTPYCVWTHIQHNVCFLSRVRFQGHTWYCSVVALVVLVGVVGEWHTLSTCYHTHKLRMAMGFPVSEVLAAVW